MGMASTSDGHKEVAQLQEQLDILRRSIAEVEHVLRGYVTGQDALRQSEEQFRLLVTSVRDYAIFMLDSHGRIVSWNTGAELIKGYRAEEIIGHHFSVFYPAEDVAAHRPERALRIAAEQGVYKEEGRRVRKDGSLFWASVVITALYDHQGNLRGFGKVTRDLTEQKQVEEDRQRLQAQALQIEHEQMARAHAEANVRLRDEFLTSTAHELRTPVTSLLGFAQLLQRRFERSEFTPERVEGPVRTIILQAKHLDRLTTMLLDMTRLEDGHLMLELAPVDLRMILERIAQELQPLTDQHSLVLDLSPFPLIVNADELHIEQALYNLVQNAIKYTPMGGTITITAWPEGQHAIITVADNGMGIPPEDLPHIFDRFYRASNIHQDNINGLGLGLYLVNMFVTMLGGTVSVESTLNQGTTFRVELMLAAEQHGVAIE